MPCQTQSSQQPQQPTTVLPQNLPKTQADWQRFLQRMNELLGSINNAQYATGVNAVPTDYAVYDGTGLPALRITGATSAFDTTHAQFGSGSLKLTATASTVTVELGASGYPVTLHPNWQWIASLFLLTSVTTIAGKLSIVTAAKQYDTDISGSPGASWSRLYGDYDLTADASTSCTLLLTLTGVTVGQVFNLEGWMLEPSQGAVLPSPFIMTSGPRTWAQVVNDGNKPQDGADVTAFHTAADTAAVNGVPAATVNINITTAQTTANTANTTANNAQPAAIVNPGFDQGMYGWTPESDASNWYAETGTNGPNAGTTTYMVHAGSNTTTFLRNAFRAPVVPGQIIKATCKVKGLSNPTGTPAIRILFQDINNNDIPGSPVTSGTVGNGVQLLSVIATAPSNAAYATISPGVGYGTGGYYNFDDMAWTYQPSSVDEVPDGSTYGRPLASRLSGGNPLIDFAAGYHLNKTLDNIADTSNWARAAASRINAGRPLIDFSEAIHLNKKLDWLADTPSYAKSPAMGGSAIVVPNANFLASVDAAGNIPGWAAANGATLAYFAGTLPFGSAQCLHVTFIGSSPSGFGAQSPSFKADAGDTFFVRGWAYADTGAAAQIIIYFFNSSANYLGQVTASTSGYGTWQQISASGIAPTGTAFALVRLFNPNTGGGSSYFYGIGVTRAHSLDNEVVDGSIYLRMPGANMDANRRGLIDFTQGGHLNKNVDNIADGATYARIYGSELSSGKHRLGVVGSGYQVGDQRNLKQRTITNYPSKVSPGVSYSASAGTPATATISVAAFTALLGSVSVSYNAASASVTGTGGTNVNYYLYFNDPTYAGGTQTLVATTNQNDLYSGDGYVYVGYVTVAFPSSGSGSGGGTGCPLRTSWVVRRGRHGRPQHVRAGKVRVGDWLLRTDGEWAEVTFSRPELQPCVRLVADGFGTLGCSVSAPMQLREGSALSIACLAREVVVRRGAASGHAVVTDLHDLGDQWVQHITLANAPDDFFWTGDAKDALFGHHNAKPP